eukprot:TRINITY_DN9444_c0_g1_i4.p1 TRINITY_DN9444_c0_g1~~TRINITY_DN9444_c0_g1_i4.p1  ORF type:complete len:456 (-),score=62.51 TRINITY_DN9444_c0_g1_i4:330-1697(-)
MEFDCRLRSVGCNYLEGYLEEWKLIALCDGPVIRVFMCEDREDFRISSTEPIFAIASYFGQTDSEILRLCWRLDDENAYLCIHTLKGIQIHLVEKKSAKYSHQFVCSIAADKLSKFAWHPIYLFLAVHRQGFVYFYKPAQGDPIKTVNMQNQNQCSGISWSHDGRSLMLLHSNMITTSTWSMSASLDDFLVDPCLSHLMTERNTPRNILSAKDIGFLVFYEANVADIESIRRIRDVQTPSFETELTPLSGDVIDTTTHVPNGKSDRTVSNMFNLSQILESSPRALVYLVQLHDGHCKVQHVVELDSNIKDPDVVVVAKDGTLFGVSSSNTPEVHIYSCSQEGSKPFHSFKISKGKVKGLAMNESGCMALIGEPGPKKGLFSTSLSAVFKVNFQSFAWKNRKSKLNLEYNCTILADLVTLSKERKGKENCKFAIQIICTKAFAPGFSELHTKCPLC